MRKRRMSIPKIDIHGSSSYPKGSYNWVTNTLFFGRDCNNISEDGIIDILIHETDHWMQNMYLDHKERNAFIRGNRKHYPIIVEYANILPGEYDYTGLESKYNRGITACKFV